MKQSNWVKSFTYRLVFKYHFQEVPQPKVWPHFINESKDTLITLVQQKVGKSHFTRSSDVQVGFDIVSSTKVALEILFTQVIFFLRLFKRFENLIFGVVTDAYIEKAMVIIRRDFLSVS